MIKSCVLLFKLLDKARDKTQLRLPAAFDLLGFEIKYSHCDRHNCVLVKTASLGSSITWGLGLPPLSMLRRKSPKSVSEPSGSGAPQARDGLHTKSSPTCKAEARALVCLGKGTEKHQGTRPRLCRRSVSQQGHSPDACMVHHKALLAPQ